MMYKKELYRNGGRTAVNAILRHFFLQFLQNLNFWRYSLTYFFLKTFFSLILTHFKHIITFKKLCKFRKRNKLVSNDAKFSSSARGSKIKFWRKITVFSVSSGSASIYSQEFLLVHKCYCYTNSQCCNFFLSRVAALVLKSSTSASRLCSRATQKARQNNQSINHNMSPVGKSKQNTTLSYTSRRNMKI